MIKTAFRFPNNMVVVFDRKGRQISKYQGQYEDMKESVLRDAPPEALFAHGFTNDGELRKVPRGDW